MYYLKGVGYFGSLNNALGLGDLAAVKTYKQAREYANGAIKVIENEISNLPAEKHGPYLTSKQKYLIAFEMAKTNNFPIEQIVEELASADRYYDEVIGRDKTSPSWGFDPKTGQVVTAPLPASAIVPGAPSDATVSQAPPKVKGEPLKRQPRKIPYLWAGVGVGAFTLLALLWLNYKKQRNPWAAVLPRGFYVYDKPSEAIRKSIQLQQRGERARFSEFPLPEETRRWMRERERES